MFHPYYTTSLAPAIAALAGVGGVLLYGAYRGPVRWSWVLPGGVAVTGAWSFALLNRTPDWIPWLRWVIVAGNGQAGNGQAPPQGRGGMLVVTTGEPVIAMGGFTGQDPAMTVARLQEYVRRGELRHIVIGGPGRSGPMSGDPAIAQWVRQHGTRVPASTYGGTSGEGGGELYRLG
ncbi:hypothetical protein [Nonomuraea sp. NPDC001023]|uniref:hypothetical protein n=1 Tax=unclassified Nonomuraea TaxID=2593643 RepID=UPI00332F8A71